MTKTLAQRLDLAQRLVPIARQAGEIELRYYHAGAEVLDKADGSPVTLADQEAEALIVAALAELAPDIPMVGEESVAAHTIPDISGGRFFLVDPLDGTKEFITGGGDFTVNIALLENFRPVMGVIYAPLSDTLWYGALDPASGEGQSAKGQAFVQHAGQEVRPITVRPKPDDGITVVASRRHNAPEVLEDFLKPYHVAALTNRSSSLKFCVIAEGLADLYPRLAPTSEWDTAAGEAIVHAAGGKVSNLDGTPLVYGKKDRTFLNPHFVVSSFEL